MTKRFLDFIPFVLKWEGGEYENDPDDPGGETRWGIDKRSHPNVDIRNLTKEQATQIYYAAYWEKNKCGKLPAKVGESHFDACVNTGSGRANKFLALSNGSASKYNDERDAFYHRLVAARARSQKFLKGWLNRTADLRNFLSIT